MNSLKSETSPNLSFLCYLRIDNLGLKMKTLKFLGIYPTHMSATQLNLPSMGVLVPEHMPFAMLEFKHTSLIFIGGATKNHDTSFH